MKVIDLLNKIANGEETPKKIRYSIYEYVWEYDSEKDEYCYMRYSISDEENKRIDDDWFLTCILNKELEIIEEEKKIPEKLEKIDQYFDKELEEYVAETFIDGNLYKEIYKSKYDEMIIKKLNEIIDFLKQN